MFGLAKPMFLLGALSAGIPLVLHLMRREVVRDLIFPSIRFIRKGRVPQSGRRRLQDILLLLLRMATLCLLALLLAGPFWSLDPNGDETRNTYNVVVLDLSASMTTAGRMDEAKRLVREAIETSESDAWHLILSANGIVDDVPASTGIQEVERRLVDAKPGTAAGDHAEALRRAAAILTSQASAVLHIVSDFQASDWNRESFPGIPDDITMVFHQVGDETAGNLGISNVRVLPTAGETLNVIVEIQSYQAGDAQRKVRLMSGGTEVAKDVTIPAAETVKVPLVLEKRTSDVGEIRIDTDAYDLDDSYSCWLGSPSPSKLLAVLPMESGTSGMTELFFLRKALSVTTETSDRRYDIQTADVKTFFVLDLDSIDGLLLLGAAAQLADPGFARARRFVEEGGVAIWTPATESPARQLIGLKRNGMLTARLLGTLGELQETRRPAAIGWVNAETAVGRLFADTPGNDLFLFPIRDMLILETASPTIDILRTEDGHPFLARQDIGAGSLYFFAAPLLSKWSDLPVSMAFLPMIREILAQTVGDRNPGILNLDCGEGLQIRRGLTGVVANAEQAIEWDNGDFDSPPRAGQIGDVPVQINVSRRESLVAVRPLSSLRAAMQGDAPALPATSEQNDDRRDLRPHVAALLLACVAVEAAAAARRDARERAA